MLSSLRCADFGTSKPFADVVKLADTPDLGSGAAMREGSSPFIRTILNSLAFCREFARILLLLRARGKGSIQLKFKLSTHFRMLARFAPKSKRRPCLKIAFGAHFCISFGAASSPLPPLVQNGTMILPLKSALSKKLKMICGALYHHTGKPMKIASKLDISVIYASSGREFLSLHSIVVRLCSFVQSKSALL